MNISRLVLLVFILPLTVWGDVAEEVEENLEILSFVTGFHSFQDKETSLEYRILESDTSSTVAYNPVYLYLVVTNNYPGPENQTLVVRLPSVSTLINADADIERGTLILRAKFDGAAEGGVILSDMTEGNIVVSVTLDDAGEYQVTYEVHNDD